MSKPPIATAEEIKQLLQLASVSSSDKSAKSWLQNALDAAHAFNQAAKQRSLWVDQKELLADIEKTARKLNAQLQRLRSHTYSRIAFWRAVETERAGAFGRRVVSEDESGQLLHRPARANPTDDREVLSTLSNIERAAQTAKDPRKGRPRDVGKQHVVDLAFAFFVRHSSLVPSGTPTGPFATFAHAFYGVAIKRESLDDGGLERQIREAIKRLPIERERTRYMSTLQEKNQDS